MSPEKRRENWARMDWIVSVGTSFLCLAAVTFLASQASDQTELARIQANAIKTLVRQHAEAVERQSRRLDAETGLLTEIAGQVGVPEGRVREVLTGPQTQTATNR